MTHDLTALAGRLEQFKRTLEAARKHCNNKLDVWSTDPVLIGAAESALRAAAVQGEPVAWQWRYVGETNWKTPLGGRHPSKQPEHLRQIEARPLFTAPPPAAGWEELLRDVVDNGLIYWEPNTQRGHVQKALMLAKCEKALRTPAATKSAERELLPGEAEVDAWVDSLGDDLPDHGGADAGVGEYLARPSCHCFDERSRELCLDKDRCRPIAKALSHHPAPVAANASAELSKFANDLAAKQQPLGVQISAEDLESTYIRSEPSANASAEARLRGIADDALSLAEELAGTYDWLGTGSDQARADMEKCSCLEEIRSLRSDLEALSAHPHASDCDKQGECCDLAAKEPCPDCPLPGPSDRAADVTVDELRGWLVRKGVVLSSDMLARAILDAFTVGRLS